MGSEIERIAILEARMDKYDETVSELKETQSKFRDKLEDSNGNIISLTGELKTLTANLAIHNNWHEKQSEKKFNWGQLILGMIMAAIAIMQFVNISITSSPKHIESKTAIEKTN